MARCLRNELHLALELRPLLSRFTADYVLMSCWFSTRTVSPSAVLMLCICGIENCCGLSLTRLREQWLEFTAGKALVPVAAALDHEHSAHSFITFFCSGSGCITFLCGSDRQAMISLFEALEMEIFTQRTVKTLFQLWESLWDWWVKCETLQWNIFT